MGLTVSNYRIEHKEPLGAENESYELLFDDGRAMRVRREDLAGLEHLVSIIKRQPRPSAPAVEATEHFLRCLSDALENMHPGLPIIPGWDVAKVCRHLTPNPKQRLNGGVPPAPPRPPSPSEADAQTEALRVQLGQLQTIVERQGSVIQKLQEDIENVRDNHSQQVALLNRRLNDLPKPVLVLKDAPSGKVGAEYLSAAAKEQRLDLADQMVQAVEAALQSFRRP